MKSKTYNQSHLLLFLFIIFCFIKISLIKHIPLINDEAYTLTISRHFSLSYFDHPPLMMWISYILHTFGSLDFYIYRIPYIFFGTLTGFFLYKITSLIYSKEAGTAAAILYYVSPFFFFSGGLFIVPDASLNFSVAGATYIAIRLIFNKEDNFYLWIALGLLLSLAFLSKYQAYLFGISLFIGFIIWKKNIIFTRKFNFSLFISLLGLLPVLIWNIDNNLESFSFHKNRSSFDFDILHVFKSLIAQTLFLLPTTLFLMILGLTKTRKLTFNSEYFLILLALPTIIVFNIFILGSNNGFAHWSMVGWMLLIPIAANQLLIIKSFKPKLMILNILSVFLIFSLISIVLIHSKTGFIGRIQGEKIPEWDNTRELLDWENISEILVKNLEQKDLDALATLNWYDSGQLSTALDFKYPVRVLGPNSNHFRYIYVEAKSYVTLIDIQLLNHNYDTDLEEKISGYGYRIKNRIELPFFRGKQKYGFVTVIYLAKI